MGDTPLKCLVHHEGGFELLCFVFIKSGTPIKPDFSKEYASSYYGWIRIDTNRWFVSNTANSGRIIQTEKITLLIT